MLLEARLGNMHKYFEVEATLEFRSWLEATVELELEVEVEASYVCRSTVGSR